MDSRESAHVTATSLRSLIASHSNAGASAKSRVGSIILEKRPSVIISNGEIEADQLALFDTEFSATKPACKDIVSLYSASVGRVEVADSNGEFQPIGTCFRVGSDDMVRMATAGHLLKRLLGPNNNVKTSNPFRANGDVLPARVNFHDNGQNHPIDSVNIFAIDQWVWAHPRWDLLLFDLLATPTELEHRIPLKLEKNMNQGAQTNCPICVLGYPMINDGGSSEKDPFTSTFEGPLKVKRVSPGLCTWKVASLPPATKVRTSTIVRDSASTIDHDASTLPGSSGSPIFSLDLKTVIGLHYDGGEFDEGTTEIPDPNNAVNLPVALLEPQLAAAMSDSPQPVDQPAPIRWEPKTPSWRGMGSLEAGSPLSGKAVPNTSSLKLQSVVPDRPDFRDRIYDSTLLKPKDTLLPNTYDARLIRNQHDLPACTAFALAAAINIQMRARNANDEGDRITEPVPVSEQMLYSMATLHDEWIDDSKGGSSLRGAIKGFYQNGVCLDRTAPLNRNGQHWSLSRIAAKEARSITLGAYFRLKPKLLDFQLALNETGAVLVSAHITRGWISGSDLDKGMIEAKKKRIGTHAFIILGYDKTGFIIQNSWGETWGNWNNCPGLAHWQYDDWAENLIDAWVLRLAPSTPYAFDLVPKIAKQNHQPDDDSPLKDHLPHLPRPRRFSLIGHTFQIERDRIFDGGRLGVGLDSLRETALYLASEEACKKYPHIGFFFHDALLGRDTIGKLCAHMTEPFKAHGVYPIHIIYGSDEAQTMALRVIHECNEINRRFGSMDDDLSVYIERRISQLMQPLVSVFREGIVSAAKPGNPLWQVIASIVLEAGPERQYCAYASGIAYSLIEQLPKLAGVSEKSAHTTSNDLDTKLFASKLKRLFLLAPSANLAMLDKLDVADKRKVCTLSSNREMSDILPGYRGDWIDLAVRLADLNILGTAAARESKQTRELKGFIRSKSCSLHDASAERAVLNKCLKLFRPHKNKNAQWF